MVIPSHFAKVSKPDGFVSHSRNNLGAVALYTKTGFRGEDLDYMQLRLTQVQSYLCTITMAPLVVT